MGSIETVMEWLALAKVKKVAALASEQSREQVKRSGGIQYCIFGLKNKQ